MLTTKDKLSVDDFKQMLNDHHSVQADEIKPVLIKHLEKVQDFNEAEQRACKALKAWKNVYDLEQSAPAIFDETLRQLTKNLVSDEMPNLVFKMYSKSMLASKYLIANVFTKNNSAWADDIKTGNKEDFHQILIRSFKDAVKELTSKYGKISQIHWGEIHRLKLMHPLGKVKMLDWVFVLNRDYKAPGNANTVNPFTYPADAGFDANFGASEKHIFNTADWNKSYSILPTGISGNPGSPFYCSQAADYVNGDLYMDIFSLEKVKKTAKFEMTFSKK